MIEQYRCATLTGALETFRRDTGALEYYQIDCRLMTRFGDAKAMIDAAAMAALVRPERLQRHLVRLAAMVAMRGMAASVAPARMAARPMAVAVLAAMPPGWELAGQRRC